MRSRDILNWTPKKQFVSLCIYLHWNYSLGFVDILFRMSALNVNERVIV
jgi:hypothetical protein